MKVLWLLEVKLPDFSFSEVRTCCIKLLWFIYLALFGLGCWDSGVKIFEDRYFKNYGFDLMWLSRGGHTVFLPPTCFDWFSWLLIDLWS